LNFVDRFYEAIIRLGISDAERQSEVARLKSARQTQTTNIDSQIIEELSRGNVRMKTGYFKHRQRHEAELAAFMAGSPTRPTPIATSQRLFATFDKR
jgi:hypothetical protein